MYIALSLLLLFIGSTSAGKTGDFGILTACTIKQDLRLECYYANCSSSPSFECEFKTSNGSQLTSKSKTCRYTLVNHTVEYKQNITSYNCTLTRKDRREEKQITINYNIRKGPKQIKRCRDTTGLLLHPAPALLWPVVILSLWRVLVTDSQTT
ncbi:uncharacterized protein LOC144462763 [Epinephelus lanceolatus]